MAKSESEIWLDYQRAQDVVSELRDIAKNTREVEEESYASALQTIRESWSGTNADAFMAKVQPLQGELESLGKAVDQIADTVSQIAGSLRDAELRALSAVRSSSEVGGGQPNEGS